MRALITVATLVLAAPAWAQAPRAAEMLRVEGAPGRPGGRLVVGLGAEPKTFNPVTALDAASRDVIGRLMADLVDIERDTQRTVPALARSWRASADGRQYTLELRRGLRFSDGHPLDADDVVFSFQCYLDERNASPQRDLLLVGGRPIAVRKLDGQRVAFDLAEPYAAAERLFDGMPILPRHLLQEAQQAGRLARSWGLGTSPAAMAGLGPFRLKSYVPGDRVVLERNPHYWKVDSAGRALPYLDEIVFLVVPAEDAQVIRFKAGETDVLSRIGAANFELLERDDAAGRHRLQDLGPSLEYTFLFFNLNEAGAGLSADAVRRRAWFRDLAFRQAVSAAIDRRGIVRLVYRGRATALASHVTPGNKLWVNAAVPPPVRSLPRARERLAAGGYTWRGGRLHDRDGVPVGFTIITNAANAARVQMASVIQEDLREIGVEAQVVPLENRAVLERVLRSHDYDAAIMTLASGDADPNGEMNVWLTSGPTHLWRVGAPAPLAPWEQEIDDLMRRQLVTLDVPKRKALYDRVQALVAENLPMIPLVSPNLLVAARAGLGHFRPALLEPYVLWNADELYWADPPAR